MRFLLILSQAVAIAWATVVYFTGLSANPVAVASVRVCGVWSMLVGLVFVVELARSFIMERHSWLWGAWAKGGRGRYERWAKKEDEEELSLTSKWKAELDAVARSDMFPGFLTRPESIVLSNWLENMQNYITNDLPRDNPYAKVFQGYATDLLACVYALLPVRNLVASIELLRSGKTLRYTLDGISEASVPPTAVYTVDAVKLLAPSDKIEEYKKVYGEINFRNIEDEQLMLTAYAITDKIYSIVVEKLRNCTVETDRQLTHKADQGLAAALAEVDGHFLANEHAPANRYIVNPASLKRFAALPGFAPDVGSNVGVRCGWYLARPILSSASVPENEALCVCVHENYHKGRPIAFTSDLPLTMNIDGSINIECSLHVDKPTYVRRVVIE